MVTVKIGRSPSPPISRLQWLSAPLLAAGLGVLFWPRIQWIVQLWLTDSFYSASWLVPGISVALLYVKRHNIRREDPSAAGLLLVATVVVLTIALDVTHARFYSATPLLLVIALSGIIVTGWGWRALRTLAFPLCFLLFLIPVPGAVRARFDYPLQEMCAKATTAFAHVAGIQLQRAGTLLLFPDSSLGINVARPCNGTRSTLAMIMIAVLYLYLVRGSWFRKTAVFSVVVPLAYAANFVRLFGIVLFVSWGGPKYFDFEPVCDHVLGAVVFALAVGLLFFWARLLKCDQLQEIG